MEIGEMVSDLYELNVFPHYWVWGNGAWEGTRTGKDTLLLKYAYVAVFTKKIL